MICLLPSPELPETNFVRPHDRSPYKNESVDIPYDVNDALAIAVRDWVLSEHQEVTEHDQVCGGQSRVRVTEQISAATRFGTSDFFLVATFVCCGLKFNVQ